MNKNYIEKYLQIVLDNEKYTDKQMQKVYKGHKKALEKVLDYVSRLYIDKSKDGLLQLSQVDKTRIKVDIDKLLKNIGKELAGSEVDAVNTILEGITVETTYRIAYIMDSSYKINLKFPLIRQEHIESVVNTPIEGEMFSDRIWKNKDDLCKKLKIELNSMMTGKGNIDKIARNIRKEFNVTAYESKRLARTEGARVQSTASENIAKNLGIKQQMFCATLDGKTSEGCRELDGTYWNVDDGNKPSIPRHPNCRSCWINVPKSNWKPKERLNNETEEIIDYKNYKQWKEGIE